MICVEPDPAHVEVGRRNAALNGMSERCKFIQAWVGGSNLSSYTANIETTGLPLELPCVDMGALLAINENRPFELLHMDVQGAELGFIQSLSNHTKKLRFLVVSTHHHSISGSCSTHEDCITELTRLGGLVLGEHSVEESYSGDGLIVASFNHDDQKLVLPTISRNKPEDSLFGKN